MKTRIAIGVATSSALALFAALVASACGSSSDNTATSADGGLDSNVIAANDAGGEASASNVCAPDESAPVPTSRCTTDADAGGTTPPCNTWLKVEIPGTVCGDGSQYKFFVNWSNTSNDLAVEFEPGGACWDYDSCTGNSGVRGAANPHGIPDDHMTTYQYLNLLRRSSDNPVQNYNMVFVPYCTGDIHTGNTVATYTSDGPIEAGTDDDGGEAGASEGGAGDGGLDSITFHHAGHANVLAVIDWMKTAFPAVPKLFVTGCSAGGAGAIINYHFIRNGMGSAVQCGYLLDDSGPIFHSDGPSKQLDAKITSAWNIDPILDSLSSAGTSTVTPDQLKADFGLINTLIATEFPKDRLSLTLYQMDLNYSLYSYQRFFPGSTEAQIHMMWMQDIQELLPTYMAQHNLAYYMPFFRQDNCSHCVSIPPLGDPPAIPLDETKALTMPWVGSEIPMDMIDLKAFTTDLLDDSKPLKSYIETSQPQEMFTPAVSLQCMHGG